MRRKLPPSPLSLLKMLWALMILLLPWVMLEVRPRVIWMDVFFVFWAANAFWVWHRCRPLPGLPKPVFEYGLLLLFWMSAILLSGLFVSHREAYLFEAAGLIYLAILSWALAYVTGIWSDYRRVQSILFASLAGCALFGLVGIFFGVSGRWPSIFYNNAYKLKATFKNPNQLAGFLVLFFPWLLLLVRRAASRGIQIRYVLLLLLVLVELLATGSRTGVGVAFLLLAFEGGSLLAKAAWRGHIHFRTVFFGGMGMLLLGAVVWFLRAKIGVISRALSVLQVMATGHITDPFRRQNWWLGLKTFAQYPITGRGIAQIAAEHPYEIHNTYIAVLAEMGAIGFLAFMLLVGYVLSLAWRNILLTKTEPDWNTVARGLFLGLVGELIFASQHMFLRNRALWVWFALIVAFRVYWIRRNTRRPDPCVA